jgi:hypothetical protein
MTTGSVLDDLHVVPGFYLLSLDVRAGRVTIAGSGSGGFRVPAFDPAATIAARGTIVEVKDVATLTSSPQLRDLVAYAQSRGCAARDLHECGAAAVR